MGIGDNVMVWEFEEMMDCPNREVDTKECEEKPQLICVGEEDGESIYIQDDIRNIHKQSVE